MYLHEWGPRGTTLGDMAGQAVPIDRGIPGERVKAEIRRERRNWRGAVREVLVASPDRVVPPCPYYLQGCGGCQWQHVRYEAQVTAKCGLVDRELARAGLEVRVGAAHTMSEPWRYRRTAAIALGWEAGFRPRGRRGILAIEDCPIAHPLIGRLAARLNELLRAGTVPPYHGKVWLDCTVVGSTVEPELQVLIQGIEGLTLETHPELPHVAELLAAVNGVGTVAFRHRSGEAVPLVGDLMGRIQIAGRWMYLPAGAFFQTNLRMLERLIERMRGVIAGAPAGCIADVYGGVGTFGLPLAEQADRVVLIELDSQAVRAAWQTAQDWGVQNVEFVDRHAEQALPALRALDLAIVDPPRSGIGDLVAEALCASSATTVLYVSCAPPSLARDLARLTAGGFGIESLEIFDFYPQTYHVESLAVLRR